MEAAEAREGEGEGKEKARESKRRDPRRRDPRRRERRRRREEGGLEVLSARVHDGTRLRERGAETETERTQTGFARTTRKIFHRPSKRLRQLSARERRSDAEFERRCASEDPSDRLFDTQAPPTSPRRRVSRAGRALRTPSPARAFSDVFLTHHRNDVSTRAFGDGDAVLKCSNPFPGSINGRSAERAITWVPSRRARSQRPSTSSHPACTRRS